MPTDTSLTTAELALARHHTYMLLSRLYLEGLTAELLPYAQALPELSVNIDLEVNPFNVDYAAAEYYDLFSLNLFPYEGIFLDPTGLLGGSVSQSVADDYRQAGFSVLEAGQADHIGHELAFLGFLSGAEADAWEDQLIPIALRMQQLATDFLQKHLLRWLPPFIIALQHQPYPFYRGLADLTLELVYSQLSVPLIKMATERIREQEGEGAREDGDEQEKGMDEIASYLISPPKSGIYLSRVAIEELSREQRLPRGFGSRKQMLKNLLRVGMQYDESSTLLSALQKLLKTWQEAYTTMQRNYPYLEPFIEGWLARARECESLIEEMNSQKKEP